MRKVIVLALALVCALAAVAYAQAPTPDRTNSYAVDGSVSPTKAGTSKKPVPIGINFSYTVAEQTGLRPSPVQKYSIRFKGVRANSSMFPGCTFGKINADQGSQNCPSGSLLGKGSITARAGGEKDRTNQSILCPLNLEVYNSGKNKGAIYVVGGADAPVGKKTSCPTTTNAALDANFVRRGNEVALEFNVPLVPFRQQLGTTGDKNDPNAIEVAVVKVESKIAKKTKKVKGKTRGFFEAIGGCSNGSRIISVTFLNEDGKTASAQDKTKCTK